jgi:hypothetical protein
MRFIEYRARYQEVNGYAHVIIFAQTLDRVKALMAIDNIVNCYVIEGFDGDEWHQIKKTDDYDLN